MGIAGGFGTVSIGKMDNASQNHFGGIVDNSGFLGGNSEIASNKVGNTISYAASVGSMSFQADVIGDRNGDQDKDMDAAQLGATVQIGDNAKIGFAYVDNATKGKSKPLKEIKADIKCDPIKDNDDDDSTAIEISSANTNNTPHCERIEAQAADKTAHIDDDRAAMIAGQYTIGGVNLHLGYGQRKWDTDSKAQGWQAYKAATGTEGTDGYSAAKAADYGDGLEIDDMLDKKQKSTFFGAGGSLGDTGVNFFVQVHSNKTTTNSVMGSYQEQRAKDALAKDFKSNEVRGVGVPEDAWAEAKEADEVRGSSDTTARAALNTAVAGQLSALDSAGTAVQNITVSDTTATSTQAADITAQATKDRARSKKESSVKNTPFVIGVSRSLGGGASIHLEHANTDDDASKNQTALILKVDF